MSTRKSINGVTFQPGPKKRTSQGDGLRKRGTYKSRKRYRGQGR